MQQKKYRSKHGLFIAEGPKVIPELEKSGMQIHAFFSTEVEEDNGNSFHVTEKELQKISCLTTANTSLALFKIPQYITTKTKGLTVALDAIRDPGNLGTIIRMCDWFGIKQLICSEDTADCYNPKVVQASMGSLARVQIAYVNLEQFFSSTTQSIYGAAMHGENVYKTNLPNDGILVMGNEANGISKPIMEKLSHVIAIPQFGNIQETESLNVATATAILLSEFRRFTET